jgi:prolipoprotein diacylglyceryltransferase
MTHIPEFDHAIFPVFYIAGAIVFTLLFFIGGRKHRIPAEQQLLFFTLTVFFSILFSKLLSSGFISQLPSFLETGELDFSFTKSVGGGVAGALLALVLCSYLLRRNNLQELLFPGWLIGLAVIKVGCFLEGCCYGIECQHLIGVTYGEGTPAFINAVLSGALDSHSTTTVSLFPVQLADALLALLIIIPTYLITKRKPLWSKAFVSLILFLFIRFFTDYLRGGRENVLITNYQWLIAVLLPAVAMIAWFFSRPRAQPVKSNYALRLALIFAAIFFVLWQESWFTRAEAFTLFIIAGPAAILSLFEWKANTQLNKYRIHYVAGAWLVILCMSQVAPDSLTLTEADTTVVADTTSISPAGENSLTPEETIPNNYSTIRVGGMAGYWTDICGGVHGYGAGGAEYSFTKYMSAKKSVTYGAGLWAGVPGSASPYAFTTMPLYSQSSVDSLFFGDKMFGFNPFFEYNAPKIGFRIGAQMGQVYALGEEINAGIVIGSRRFSFLPVANLRLGNKVYGYLEFGTHFPAPSDDPMGKIAIGWHGKKKWQNTYQIGLSDAGVYFAPQFGFRNGHFGLFIGFLPGVMNASASVGFRIPHK